LETSLLAVGGILAVYLVLLALLVVLIDFLIENDD
jgi:hypothetical protein